MTNWWATITAPKDEYGLTDAQHEEVVWHARRGEEGRDFAERLGVQGYGMDIAAFYRLLIHHGISTQ